MTELITSHFAAGQQFNEKGVRGGVWIKSTEATCNQYWQLQCLEMVPIELLVENRVVILSGHAKLTPWGTFFFGWESTLKKSPHPPCSHAMTLSTTFISSGSPHRSIRLCPLWCPEPPVCFSTTKLNPIITRCSTEPCAEQSLSCLDPSSAWLHAAHLDAPRQPLHKPPYMFYMQLFFVNVLILY